MSEPAASNSVPTAYDLHAFIERHRQPGDILYSVVDAARDYRLAMASRDVLGEPLRPLLRNAPSHMDRVGPYMARIEHGRRYRDYLKLWAERFGGNGGILLLTSAWPQATLTHLRAIFRVSDEAGGMFYFRYYDPRVIRTYLPTCTAKECRTFFGPLRSILVEGESGRIMHEYRAGQAAVHLETRPIEETGADGPWPEATPV